MRLFPHRFLAVGGLLLLAPLCVAILAGPNYFRANAATITVTNTNDNGPGSLRQALADAQDGGTIQFDAALNGQTIGLASSELVINKNITISGPGPGVLTVARSQQAADFRIFNIPPSHTAEIDGLTITGGSLVGNGGGISSSATLTINNCAISGNSILTTDGVEHSGAGIYNVGTMTIVNSTVNNNQALIVGKIPPFGGGISNDGGTLTIQNTTISGNTVAGTGWGGGVYNAGSLTAINSTIRGNTGSSGGGISGGVTIINCTISGNSARFEGGGIYGGGTISNSTISGNMTTVGGSRGGGISGGFTITNSTISDNAAIQGGNICATGTVQLGNTILKTGFSGANIFLLGGTVTSHGYNLSSDNGGGFLTGDGDQINTDPLLGPLQNNGGPTFTHELLTGSPAINAGDPNFTPPPLYDQRGYLRVFNGRIDIGSLEMQPVATPSPSPTPSHTPCGLITFLSENFDSVTPPGLPAGWVSAFTPGPANCTPTGTCSLGTDWITSSTNPFTPPNCVFHDAPGCVVDSTLDTPSFQSGDNSTYLSGRISYDLENGHDGVVLEISINGGPFVDWIAAGGGGLGYNGTISTEFHSPLAGRGAWTGNSGGYLEIYHAPMPPAASGQNIRLRFRVATDCSGSGSGVRIDSVRVDALDLFCQTPTPTQPPSPTPTATATVAATPTATATATASPTPIATPCGTIFWSEDFDDLPPGPIGDGCWAISTIDPDTPPNDAFAPNPPFVSDCALYFKGITIPTASAILRFRNNFDTEFSDGIYWDGGVLEVSAPNISGGDFLDITDSHVGGSFVTGGYTGEIDGRANNPLAGRMAWSGDSGGYIDTITNLGPNLAGQTVTLRFRLGTDSAVSATGWRIDTITIADGVCPTPTATATATPTVTPSPTPPPTPSPARALNLSTRMLVQTGDSVGIGGFIITGSASKQVLLRGIGPSLAGAGVPDALADPVMELHGPAGFTTVTNDNWRDTQQAAIIATGLAPTNDLESAILVTLAPGPYTAIVKGKDNASGVGLVEVYDLGPATSQLANISTRAFVSTGDNVVIGGFILGGGDHAHIFIHAGGPPGINPTLADATLELRDGSGSLLASNENCESSIIGPPNPADACIDIILPAGAFTAILAGKNGGTGIGLLEIYNVN